MVVAVGIVVDIKIVGVVAVVVGVGVVVGGGVWWCEWWCGQSFNALQPFSSSFSGHLLLVIWYPFY